MDTKAELIGEDKEYTCYQARFEGDIVRFKIDNNTGQAFVNADDSLKVLGIANSVDEFLASDEGLDIISEWLKRHPNKPLHGKDGLFRS